MVIEIKAKLIELGEAKYQLYQFNDISEDIKQESDAVLPELSSLRKKEYTELKIIKDQGSLLSGIHGDISKSSINSVLSPIERDKPGILKPQI